ncbi:hypothetical protein PINS_up009175 [Pythium insidiosum]|nr:hypothetical protein PINS_up009175 [Pythium insidiosum]
MGENLVEKFITEDYREAVAQVLSKALDGQETANFEFPLMTKAGRRVEILLNATCRYNEHGEVIGMVGNRSGYYGSHCTRAGVQSSD